jgi:hypothetical protein
MRQPMLRIRSAFHTHPPPRGGAICLPKRQVENCKESIGEPVGIRTRDLLIKSQLLYRLSYRPTRGVT